MSLLPLLHVGPTRHLPSSPPAAERPSPARRCYCMPPPQLSTQKAVLPSSKSWTMAAGGALPCGRAEIALQAAMAQLEVSSTTCSSRGASARRRGRPGVCGHRRHTTTPALL